jgi:hypothetical protein
MEKVMQTSIELGDAGPNSLPSPRKKSSNALTNAGIAD